MGLNITATRVVQAGLGVAGVVAGFQLSGAVVRSGYTQDLFGDPNRVIESDGKRVIYQQREPQGGQLTNYMLGVGAAAAFVGGALLLGSTQVGMTGIKSMLRTGGGAALFALGTGAVAGATAISKQYSGADFENVR